MRVVKWVVNEEDDKPTYWHDNKYLLGFLDTIKSIQEDMYANKHLLVMLFYIKKSPENRNKMPL